METLDKSLRNFRLQTKILQGKSLQEKISKSKKTPSLAYRPSRERKSGIPHETEMPAPVRTNIFFDFLISSIV